MSEAFTVRGRDHATVSASPAGETVEGPCTDSCEAWQGGDAYATLWRSSRIWKRVPWEQRVMSPWSLCSGNQLESNKLTTDVPEI